jgi:hypothetical protein
MRRTPIWSRSIQGAGTPFMTLTVEVLATSLSIASIVADIGQW